MNKKIYIIDDDLDFLDIVSYIFRKNYKTLTSTSLDTELILSFQPDLIMMDNAVGHDLADIMMRKLHSAIPSFATPVILVSAHHDISRLATVKGVQGFIRKPSSISYIRAYVDSFFARCEN
jgi:response regulator RpfG family c-di-GMP phosphodiesterase